MAAGNAGNQLHDRNMWEGVGNLDKYSGSPALFSRIFGNIASVGSSNGQNDRAEYSNFGKSISISAPGGDNQSIQIQSEEDTRIYEGRREAEIFSTLPDASYGYMAGTSMASPVIAGMAALIRAQNESINARDTVAILRAGAVINSQLNSSVNQNYQANLYNSMILAQNWIGPDSLTGIGQEVAPIINLTALTDAQSLTGSLKLERDSSNDPVIGFYRVLDTSGTVLDALGNAVKPGDADYQSVALSPSNLSDGLNTLTLENNSSRSVNYSLDGLVNGFYLAPYAITANNTWFAWSQANSDRQDHFKVLGSNQFGLDDQAGPGRDGNFSDVIMSFFSSEII
nr:S8 family serine peptidase [Synechococcus sp. BIOS-U3-1]